jgi:predicted dinucleotide-binding enzyme
MKGRKVMEVIVVIGAGQIGQAIARRVSFGKHVILQKDTNKLKGSIQAGSCTRNEWRPYSALVGARNEAQP